MSQRARLRLSGRFGVLVAGSELPASEVGSRRARLLLQLLAAGRGDVVTVDTAVPVLWADGPPAHPAQAVAVLVSRLRAVLGPSAILGSRGSYRLGDEIEVDLDAAHRLLTESSARLAAEPGLASNTAAQAAEILGPGVLVDQPYAAWADEVRREHRMLLRTARHLLARAALATDDRTAGLAAAAAGIEADPLDEEAHRDLMELLRAAGRSAQALAAYGRLRTILADALGVEPSPATRALHLEILREDEVPAPEANAAPRSGDLAGRSAELARLQALWRQSVSGTARSVVVVGESGIGKTRLAAEVAVLVERTGGQVISVRCHESERSLFLQPLVDALTSLTVRISATTISELAGPDGPVLAALVPAIAAQLDLQPDESGPADVRRRRAFDAVAALLTRLSRRMPVLLLLDDLHNAGRSTLTWLDYTARRLGSARVLVVGTARVEHAVRLHGVDVEQLPLGPLDRSAVEWLAAEAGVADRAEEVLRQTSGHTLYVVELLRALAAGDAAVAPDLRTAVLERVERFGDEVLLRAAAVLGSSVDPDLLARLLGDDVVAVGSRCEAALDARLLVVAGRGYEFAHDLVREVLDDSTPRPTLIALHRRAADLVPEQPEVVARHAAAAGDHVRAARAWLRAAEEGLRRLSPLDAEALATTALETALRTGEGELAGRALLVRAVSRDASAAYSLGHADLVRAAAIGRAVGDQRLVMRALRQLGGDIPTGLGRPIEEYTGPLREALGLATALGDREVEADVLARMAVLGVSRLRFSEAAGLGRRAVEVARADGREAVVALALDGLKTVLAYLGEVGDLAPVLDELEPVLRRREDHTLLQWAVFERAFLPLAAGDLAAARLLLTEAREICRRSGFLPYEPWYVAHLGWIARLGGDLAAATALGQEAVDHAADLPHIWWHVAALSMQATTLLATGDGERATALLERAVPLAESSGAEAYRLRALAGLAEATGSREAREAATGLWAGIDCRPGSAWILGADAYLALARAHLTAGDPAQAGAVLAPLAAAVRRVPWVPLLGPVAALEAATAIRLQGRR